MQTITCKKCGAIFDASLGECPVCGAVYYIIGEQENAPEQPAPEQTPTYAAPTQHDPGVFANAGSESIFTAYSAKSEPTAEEPDPDATRAFRPITPPEEKPFRPGAPTPVRTAARPFEESGAQHIVSAEDEAQQQQHRSARSKLIICAISLLALLTLVLTIMSGAFNFSGKSNAQYMENVVGVTEETAVAMLENMGLDVTVVREASSELERTVIDQSIKEGKKIKDGQAITLTVSSGEAQSGDNEDSAIKTVSAPNLKDKTYDQAYYEATAAGLLVTTSEGVYSDDVPEDSVVSQSPAAGSSMQEGDIITLILSKGPEPSPSPETMTITALAGAGGSISPKGTVEVEQGGSMSFTITPDTGYSVKEVKVDGQDVGAVSSYTFSNVTESHSIYVVFSLSILNW
ncbi:MAG: PASTA domain-containing protein [Clostridia bacterium]|nr:PASTA domain-containing protein [Clostridia bacterium]